MAESLLYHDVILSKEYSKTWVHCINQRTKVDIQSGLVECLDILQSVPITRDIIQYFTELSLTPSVRMIRIQHTGDLSYSDFITELQDPTLLSPTWCEVLAHSETCESVKLKGNHKGWIKGFGRPCVESGTVTNTNWVPRVLSESRRQWVGYFWLELKSVKWSSTLTLLPWQGSSKYGLWPSIWSQAVVLLVVTL